MRPAGKDFGVAIMLGKQPARVADGFWFEILEVLHCG
jgi:hypothetical protein